MIYILYGAESYLINNKLNEIINKNKDAYLTRINGLDKSFNVHELVDNCRSVGLFSNKSLILVKDPPFLIKKYDDNEINEIIDYCHNPEYETELVFYTLTNEFNERLKSFKEISTNADVIKFNVLSKNEFFSYARSLINSANIKIDKNATNLLIDACNFDISLLNKNLEVLSLYPESIDETALNKLISFSTDEDVFNLINALTTKKVSLSIKYARKIMANDDSLLRLISTLANQLRFLYSVNYYKSIGKNTSEIMNILNVKSSYRIEKAFETLGSISSNDIETLLSKLSDLDYKCKKENYIDDKLNFELFIVSLTK